MLDVNKVRKDFPFFSSNPDLIYFDNGATTQKPQCVIDTVSEFYTLGAANVHRGDYPLSLHWDALYDKTRESFAKLLNCQANEIVYTAGSTHSMNQIAYGLQKNFLKPGDVVLITENEHASNVMPWFRMRQESGIQYEYIPVDKQGNIHMEDAKKAMHAGVKAIAVAGVTNVLGAKQPLKELAALAHENGALMIVDGAQSVPHGPTDVQDLDIDFLGFSGHKMGGPGGTGIIYGKYDLLQKMEPVFLGGGMNARFEACGDMLYQEAPEKFEAGTPNIEGVIGLGRAAEYLLSLGMENIEEYEKDLRAYFAARMKELDNVEFYNPDNAYGPIAFNVKDVFAQDTGSYLAANNICVRSGNHCAKILHEVIGTDSTVRASLYFYNTKEEVDRFIEVTKEITLEKAVGIFF